MAARSAPSAGAAAKHRATVLTAGVAARRAAMAAAVAWLTSRGRPWPTPTSTARTQRAWLGRYRASILPAWVSSSPDAMACASKADSGSFVALKSAGTSTTRASQASWAAPARSRDLSSKFIIAVFLLTDVIPFLHPQGVGPQLWRHPDRAGHGGHDHDPDPHARPSLARQLQSVRCDAGDGLQRVDLSSQHHDHGPVRGHRGYPVTVVPGQ